MTVKLRSLILGDPNHFDSTSDAILFYEEGLLEEVSAISKVQQSNTILQISFDHSSLLRNYFAASEKYFPWSNALLSSGFEFNVTLEKQKSDCVSETRCMLIAKHFETLMKKWGDKIIMDQSPNLCHVSWKALEIFSHSTKIASQDEMIKMQIIINFTSKSHNSSSEVISIVCAPVLDQLTGTKLQISTEEYISHLEDELFRASERKYGEMNISWLRHHLKLVAQNCYILQMLAVSHLSAIKVSTDHAKNTKESVFVLYNYARLCILFKKFEELVSKGIVPSLPPSEHVDYTLLKEQEEWQLFRTFIYQFPNVLSTMRKAITDKLCSAAQSKTGGVSAARASLDDRDSKIESLSDSTATAPISNNFNASNLSNLKCSQIHLPLHSIVRFLRDLARCLSVYYNRIHVLPCTSRDGKILPHTSSHLFPLLYARIYLLKRVQSIMLFCFQTLGIEPPTEL